MRWTVSLSGQAIPAIPAIPAVLAILAVLVTCAPAEHLPEVVRSVTVRGHQEVLLDEDGEVRPLLVEPGRVGLCLETDPTLDTSAWQGRWRSGPGDQTWAAPTARMETTLCFETPSVVSAADREIDSLDLCLDLQDAFDGRAWQLPCSRLAVRIDTGARLDLVTRMAALIADRGASRVDLIPALESLGRQAAASGYPLLAVRLRLIAVYFLRREGSEESLAEAGDRLGSSPEWLAEPAATLWAAQWAQERAALALAADLDLETAWRALASADAAYLRVADPKRFTVAMQRAEVLGRVGALREAVTGLRNALADCDRSPCEPALVDPARGVLAWSILLDPLSGPEDLAEAEEILRSALAAIDPSEDPVEHANQRINLAFLLVRKGEEPDEELTAAQRLLGPLETSARRAQLLEWGTLLRSERHLRAGRPQEGQGECLALAGGASTPRLRAWAVSCVGRARRALGDLDGAAAAFERAMLLHELATAEKMGLEIPLDPGQRADDFYRASLLAVERGDAATAWDLLARLDRLAVRGRRGGRGASPEREARRRQLAAQVTALDLPASGTRRDQRDSISRALRRELQELDRTLDTSAAPLREAADETLDYRAMAVDGEVVVLRRRGAEVDLHRRVSLPLSRLVEMVRWTDEAMREGAEDRAWRRTLRPIADALLPESGDDGGEDGVVSYALQGVLQAVPLTALPVGEAEWSGTRWSLVVRPAGALAVAATAEWNTATALFVVDPRENLASGRESAETYRRLFPDAEVLARGQATRSAVRSALADSRWLHLDTHGHFDAAFPELSTLALADGSVGLSDLGAWEQRLELANLSGCETGRWPITADSGRYGLAGLMCRRGTAWVVASRAPVTDEVAAGFNRNFYGRLAGGGTIPAAFRHAVSELSSRRRASEWGTLLLLEAGRTEAAREKVRAIRSTHDSLKGESGLIGESQGVERE